jgi:3-phenylpropionate/cinnamic acid dioxygenase small subunit
VGGREQETVVDAIEALPEIEEIRALKARYFRLMDTKQWVEWGELFTADARMRLGSEAYEILEGRAAIVDGVSRILSDAVTVHHGFTPEIHIEDGERATGIWATADDVARGGVRSVGAGHHYDEYRKEASGWCIASTAVVQLRRDVHESADVVAARVSIGDAVARYNVAADAGRFDEALSVFTEDAVMELATGTHRGRDAIRGLFTDTADALRGEAPGVVRHLSTTLRVDVHDADRASGRAYYLVLLARGPDHWGRYVDEYRREGAVWRIAHRRVTVDGVTPGGWAARRASGS